MGVELSGAARFAVSAKSAQPMRHLDVQGELRLTSHRIVVLGRGVTELDAATVNKHALLVKTAPSEIA
jgi:hypothetical protein